MLQPSTLYKEAKVTPLNTAINPSLFNTADRANQESVTSANRTAVSGFASQRPPLNRSAVNSVQKKRANEPLRHSSRPRPNTKSSRPQILFDEEAADRNDKNNSFHDKLDNE